MNNNNNNNQMNLQMSQIKQLWQNMMSFKNPQIAINQMIMNNPQTREALNFIKQNGNNPQNAFINLARQKGVDPEKFIHELMSQ